MATDMATDMAKYEQLANDVFVYGSVSLALAMAKETKVIDVLCTAEEPLSSIDLASRLQLKERYVREIVDSLTVIGLIHLKAGTGGKDGEEARYWVPHTCRPVLDNVSIFSLAISASARQFATIKECFALKGPNGPRYESIAFDTIDKWAILQLDGITEGILKTPNLKEKLEKESLKVLEVGCGTGRLSVRFASMFPKIHITLTDISSEPIESARKHAQEAKVTNVSFQLLDVCQMPDDLQDSFDWILSSELIHDLPYPSKALQGICKALKPGGHYSLSDQFVSSYVGENIDRKDSAALYSISTFMCIPESYQQPDSAALGACWGTEKATKLVKEAGMNVIGWARSEALGTMAVCMCQKPE